jgi:hypothetical protein
MAAVARLEPEAARASAALAEAAGLKRELERQDATIAMLQALVGKADAGSSRVASGAARSTK